MFTLRKNDNPISIINKETGTYKIYKSKRNNSLPDMSQLIRNSQSKSKEKLKYNKWYIKPELRLKTSINQEPHFN